MTWIRASDLEKFKRKGANRSVSRWDRNKNFIFRYRQQGIWFLSWINAMSGGLLPYICLLGMCRSKGYGFCSVWYKNECRPPSLVWNHEGMVFEETTGTYERIYRFNSKWTRWQRNMLIRNGSYYWRSNLTIWWHNFLRCQVWKRVWKWHFFGLK